MSIDSSLNTAMHYAIAYGWFFSVKLLIEGGANLNLINNYQMTCLSIAFSKGHYEICDYLFEQSKNSINIQTPQGLTLLMIIVNLKISSKTFEQFERIAIKYQADCTLVDINGRNAFHYLALNCLNENNLNESFFRIAQILLNQKCNPIQMDNKAQTPLINALQSKNYILVDFLINYAKIEFNSDVCYNGKTLLHYFAINCDNEQLTQMLINVYHIDQLKLMTKIIDGEGRTPFHYCIKRFNEFCQTNHNSNELTIKKQYQSIVNMIRYFLEILECDPDIKIQSKCDRSPIEQPNIFYLLRTISFIDQINEHPLNIFLNKTKNLNIFHCQTQRSPLLEAIYLKENKIIDILLNHPFYDINLGTLSQNKENPLIIACKLQFFSLIRQLLVNSKCNPLIYDEEHNQALHYYLSTSQRSDEYLQVFNLFIEKLKLIDKNSLNNQGKSNRTPLHIAIYHNRYI